jgi:predicted  nucleic acid-binding Zn-ribbon protein
MARGWESKSVEEQQSEFNASSKTQKATKSVVALTARRVQALRLALANVHQQLERAQNDRHKDLLQRELQYLEHELATVLKDQSDGLSKV